MSNCKYETKNVRCGLKGSYAYRHKCFTEDLCKCHEPMTNADRIRAMTDEELAKLVAKYVYCGLCPLKQRCVAGGCNKVVMEWLKEPAEGDA